MGVTVAAGPAKAVARHEWGDPGAPVKASGSGSEGSNEGGVEVVKSVHQNWCISCQNWHIKGLDSASTYS